MSSTEQALSKSRDKQAKQDGVVDLNALLREMALKDGTVQSDTEPERKRERIVGVRAVTPQMGAWKTPLSFKESAAKSAKSSPVVNSQKMDTGHSVTGAPTMDLVGESGELKEGALKKKNIKKLNGPKVRVATFNTENQVARYKFKSGLPSCSNTFTRNDTAFSVHDSQQKKLSAAVINDCNADIMCLVEVENLTTIDYFNKAFLQHQGYRYTVQIEAHDPRFINVAVMSRYPIMHARSHKDDLDQYGNYLQTRSCLEVDVDVKGVPQTLYLNHFRSMRGNDDGRWESSRRRAEQSERVREIVDERWGAVGHSGNFIVLGDLNDKNDNLSSIRCLTKHPKQENVVERLPLEEQWTHHFNGENSYSQLDYQLVSKTLAQQPDNRDTVPVVVRTGLPLRAEKYTGPRHHTVGYERPKASDHCPVYMDLQQFVPLSHPMPYPFPRPLPQQYSEYKPWNVVPFKVTPVSSRPQFQMLLKMMNSTLNNSNNVKSGLTGNTPPPTATTTSTAVTPSPPPLPLQVAEWNEAGWKAQASKGIKMPVNPHTVLLEQAKMDLSNTAESHAKTEKLQSHLHSQQLKQQKQEKQENIASTPIMPAALIHPSGVPTPVLSPSDMRRGLQPDPVEFFLDGNVVLGDGIVNPLAEEVAVSLGPMNSIHSGSVRSEGSILKNSMYITAPHSALKPSSRSGAGSVGLTNSNTVKTLSSCSSPPLLPSQTEQGNEETLAVAASTFLKPLAMPMPSISTDKTRNYVSNNPTSMKTALSTSDAPGSMFNYANTQRTLQYAMNPESVRGIMSDAKPATAKKRKPKKKVEISTSGEEIIFPDEDDDYDGLEPDEYEQELDMYQQIDDDGNIRQGRVSKIQDQMSTQSYHMAKLPPLKYHFTNGFNPASAPQQNNIVKSHVETQISEDKKKKKVDGSISPRKKHEEAGVESALPPSEDPSPIQAHAYIEYNSRLLLGQSAANQLFKQARNGEEEELVVSGMNSNSNPVQEDQDEENAPALQTDGVAKSSPYMSGKPLKHPILADQAVVSSLVPSNTRILSLNTPPPAPTTTTATTGTPSNMNDNSSIHGSDVTSTKDDWGVKSRAYSSGHAAYVQPDKQSWDTLYTRIKPQEELLPTLQKLVEEQKSQIRQQQEAINVLHEQQLHTNTRTNSNSNAITSVYPRYIDSSTTTGGPCAGVHASDDQELLQNDAEHHHHHHGNEGEKRVFLTPPLVSPSSAGISECSEGAAILHVEQDPVKLEIVDGIVQLSLPSKLVSTPSQPTIVITPPNSTSQHDDATVTPEPPTTTAPIDNDDEDSHFSFKFDIESATEEQLLYALEYDSNHPEANIPHNRVKLWKTELKKFDTKTHTKKITSSRGRSTETKSPYLPARDSQTTPEDHLTLDDSDTDDAEHSDNPTKQKVRQQKREKKRERFLERQAVIKRSKSRKKRENSDSDE